jgi:16S rRNA processing protein RimM
MAEGVVWLTLGRIRRGRGLRGEVVVASFVEGTEPFSAASELVLFGGQLAPGGESFRVERTWLQRDQTILKLAGVDSLEAAERLRGAEIRAKKSQLPIEQDEYFMADLVDCQVLDNQTGELIGAVAGWQRTAGHLLIEITDAAGREILVPFARRIFVRIDLAVREIRLEMPEGLKDLNRP